MMSVFPSMTSSPTRTHACRHRNSSSPVGAKYMADPTTGRDGKLRCLSARWSRSANCWHISERPQRFSSTKEAIASSRAPRCVGVSIEEEPVRRLDGWGRTPVTFWRRISSTADLIPAGTIRRYCSTVALTAGETSLLLACIRFLPAPQSLVLRSENPVVWKLRRTSSKATRSLLSSCKSPNPNNPLSADQFCEL